MAIPLHFPPRRTHIIKTRSVKRNLDHLQSGIVADADAGVLRQRQIRETEMAREGVPRWSRDLEHGDNHVGHVWRGGTEPHVDVEE